MQQFIVPQFIDVEDKIIGPITTRQFIILLVGFILIGVGYRIFDFSLFLTVGIIILIISGAFAFVRINGRPFHLFVLNVFQTVKRPSLRIWNNLTHKTIVAEKEKEKIIEQAVIVPPAKHYLKSKLAELSLIVDTKGVYREAEQEEEKKIEIL